MVLLSGEVTPHCRFVPSFFHLYRYSRNRHCKDRSLYSPVLQTEHVALAEHVEASKRPTLVPVILTTKKKTQHHQVHFSGQVRRAITNPAKLLPLSSRW